MAYYNVCPKCGATLDPGEHCDCESKAKKEREHFEKAMRLNPKTGQYSLNLKVENRKGGHYG